MHQDTILLPADIRQQLFSSQCIRTDKLNKINKLEAELVQGWIAVTAGLDDVTTRFTLQCFTGPFSGCTSCSAELRWVPRMLQHLDHV